MRLRAARIGLALLFSSHVSALAVEASAAGFGPAPRDAEGRFLNSAGDIPFASPLVAWPFFLRRVSSMISGRSGYPEVVANDGAFLRKNAGHSVPTVTWIGHATVLVQMGDQTFLTDPIWSERASPVSFAGPKRAVPPGVALDALPPIDFVLISHNHYDHLDVDTLAALAERSATTRFVVPLGNAATLREAGVENVIELDWGQSVRLGDLRAVCLPTQHWSRRGLNDSRRALWASWAVIGKERRLYFAGDSGYFPAFAGIGKTYGPFHLAVLPIGAYSPAAMMQHWHMNPEEAVKAGRDAEARAVMGMHYGTFDLSDEPPSEPPQRFRAAATAAGYARDSILTPRIGETRQF